MSVGNANPCPKNTNFRQPADQARPPVLCWKCKGNHPPGSCPHYNSPDPSSKNSRQQVPKHPVTSQKLKGPSGNGSVSLVKSKTFSHTRPPKQDTSGESNSSTTCDSPDISSSPQQLIVPVSIGSWHGKAILDTGSSYTLLHEYLWREVKMAKDNLQPWTEGPLYLAKGEAATPSGWVNLTLALHGHTCSPPVAVLGPKALAYGIVLGLDFISSVGMIINVADREYSFKSNPSVSYPFQPGNAYFPQKKYHRGKLNPPEKRAIRF